MLVWYDFCPIILLWIGPIFLFDVRPIFLLLVDPIFYCFLGFLEVFYRLAHIYSKKIEGEGKVGVAVTIISNPYGCPY
jgi:hypothetical protein